MQLSELGALVDGFKTRVATKVLVFQIPDEVRTITSFVTHMRKCWDNNEVYFYQFEDYLSKKEVASASVIINKIIAIEYFSDFFQKWQQESEDIPNHIKKHGCPGLFDEPEDFTL